MIEALLGGLFGLLFGSFLNVCIYRWSRDLSVVQPRSFCPSCRKTIPWYDNVPILSYTLLRGRCRHCGAGIAVRYLLVEIATGLFFAVAAYRYGLTLGAVRWATYSALLIGLIASDLEEYLLPDQMTLGGIVAGLFFAVFDPLTPSLSLVAMPWNQNVRLFSVFESLVGAAVPSFLIWSVGEIYFRVRRREGLGLGDVKMIAMLGAFLGLQMSLLVLVVASVAGSVFGLVYIFSTRANAATHQIPFGVFLGLSGLAVWLGGDAIFRWYAGLGA